jgi:acyl-CoA thioester hydrolase
LAESNELNEYRMPPNPWPHIAGRIVEGGRHVLPVRIYFEDTDFSGVVYHASYLRFMERGRSDFVRLIGVGPSELHDGAFGERMGFAVRRIHMDFFRPARIDDLIEVETALKTMTGARVILRQTIRRGEDTLTDAEVTVVLVSADGRAKRIPDAVRRRLGGEVPG